MRGGETENTMTLLCLNQDNSRLQEKEFSGIVSGSLNWEKNQEPNQLPEKLCFPNRVPSSGTLALAQRRGSIRRGKRPQKGKLGWKGAEQVTGKQELQGDRR